MHEDRRRGRARCGACTSGQMGGVPLPSSTAGRSLPGTALCLRPGWASARDIPLASSGADTIPQANPACCLSGRPSPHALGTGRGRGVLERPTRPAQSGGGGHRRRAGATFWSRCDSALRVWRRHDRPRLLAPDRAAETAKTPLTGLRFHLHRAATTPTYSGPVRAPRMERLSFATEA